MWFFFDVIRTGIRTDSFAFMETQWIIITCSYVQYSPGYWLATIASSALPKYKWCKLWVGTHTCSLWRHWLICINMSTYLQTYITKITRLLYYLIFYRFQHCLITKPTKCFEVFFSNLSRKTFFKKILKLLICMLVPKYSF